MAHDEDAVSTAAEEAMRYFDLHPQGADTAEWIRRWWLQRPDGDQATVQAALDRLVESGLVERHEAAGKPPVYSRRRSTSPESLE